jgi:hypothetical protein
MTIVLLTSWIDSDVEWFLKIFFVPLLPTLRLQRLAVFDREDPFSAIIQCTRPGQSRQANEKQVVPLHPVCGGLQSGFRATGPLHPAQGRDQRVRRPVHQALRPRGRVQNRAMNNGP